jgi:pantoate--beta-alanine ligase
MTELSHDPAVLRAPRSGRRAVVMTMGALHEGHASLVRAARAWAGSDGQVVVTVFVNPLQFGPSEDFDRYPRSLPGDVEVGAAAGADLVFAPEVTTMYPGGEPSTRVVPGAVAEELEGAVRPGHFSGMLTVVLKLLNLTQPDAAFFGEKDYQQLVLIRRMAADFNLASQIIAVPTSREPDGLARSSRNRYLDPDQRRAAVAVSRSLRAAQRTAGSGGSGTAVLEAAAAELLGQQIDYLELRGPELEAPPASGDARLLVAARFGATRLLDNAAIRLLPSEPAGEVSGRPTP